MAAWVYLLRCRDGSLYCGWTTDPEKRLLAHNSCRGAAYTRSRKPVTLVWCETCADRSAALRREIAIKRLSRARKLALIAQAQTTNLSQKMPTDPGTPPGGSSSSSTSD